MDRTQCWVIRHLLQSTRALHAVRQVCTMLDESLQARLITGVWRHGGELSAQDWDILHSAKEPPTVEFAFVFRTAHITLILLDC